MLGSVNKLFQQNTFTQQSAEKKGFASSDNRSEFEKTLDAQSSKSDNKPAKNEKNEFVKRSPAEQATLNNKNNNSSSKIDSKLDDQSEKMASNDESNKDFNNEGMDPGSNLPTSGKLSPGEKVVPGEVKEPTYINPLYANSYKVDAKKNQQEEISIENSDDLSKKLALQSFMKRMKEELGVEPSRIVKAFSSLSMEEMTRPPEENVDKIIQSLGLNQQQQLVAHKIFDDMLKQTASQSMADYLKTSGRDLSLNVMTEKEIKQQQLARSLDGMNDKFFMKDAQLKNQEASKKQYAVTEDGTVLGAASLAKESMSAASAGSTAAASTPATMASAPTVAPMATPTNMASMKPVLEQMSEVSPKEQAELQQQLKNVLSQQVPSAKAESFQMAAKAQSPMMTAGAGAAVGVGALSMLVGDDADSFEESAADDHAATDLSTLVGAQQHIAPTDKKEMTFAAAVTPQTLQQADSGNVKELINQAQFLARRGGGEMKIKLNPDGLGEVQMKVALNDGQLQVQMVTESNEAKKMIERGLGELKATLAAHQLNVDQIKVDSAQNFLDKQMAQYQEDSQRQSARQFMEQFRQDNSGWKRNFYDIPTARAYRSQREDALEPAVPVQAMADRAKATSKRLNLVA